MPDASLDDLDLNSIQDPNVRRALRSLHQQMTASFHQQQLEIDALLEIMLEKHIGSLGEFKRQLVRLQQNQARTVRIHEAIAAAAQETTAHRAQ